VLAHRNRLPEAGAGQGEFEATSRGTARPSQEPQPGGRGRTAVHQLANDTDTCCSSVTGEYVVRAGPAYRISGGGSRHRQGTPLGCASSGPPFPRGADHSPAGSVRPWKTTYSCDVTSGASIKQHPPLGGSPNNPLQWPVAISAGMQATNLLRWSWRWPFPAGTGC